MSWPGGGGDWSSSSSSSSHSDMSMGGGGGGGGHDGRPVDLASVGTLTRNGKLLELTPEQVELNLRQLGVPFDSLPQLPAFARLFGFSTDWHRKMIARTVAETSLRMGRLLTPEEADAIAQHRSRLCSRVVWVPPVYLSATAYLAWRGRRTFRFPFYTPKPASFNPSAFPNPARPLLRGRWAEHSWHLMRFGAYGILCHIVTTSLIVSVADAKFLMGVLSDPRLKEIREAATRPKDPLGYPRRTTAAPHPFPRGPPAGADEATPSQPPRPGFDDGQLQHRQPHSQWAQRQQQHQQHQQQQQAAPETRSAFDDGDNEGYLFDDASPVAPSQRRQPPGSSSPGAEGSAWERIRQQARAEADGWSQAAAGHGQGGVPRGQPRTEQYTFTSGEQERAYAREQAQKEFDAMLERERRGVGESGGGTRS